MRVKRRLILALSLFLISNLVYAEAPKQVTNIDWLLMSRKEKSDFILSAMKRLQSQGIPLSRTPQQYISEIDTVADSPNLKPAPVDKILTALVLVNEPGSRKAFDQSRKAASQ